MIVYVNLESTLGIEREYEVEVAFHKGEKRTYMHPGCPDENEILGIWRDGYDITRWVRKSVKLEMLFQEKVDEEVEAYG